jgi:hypothetical protein
MVKQKVPLNNAEPAIGPMDALIVRPAGSAPVATTNCYGNVPLAAVIVTLSQCRQRQRLRSLGTQSSIWPDPT